jgi:hypothetical protein
MAVFAPMPSASVSTAVAAKAGERFSCRIANLKSAHIFATPYGYEMRISLHARGYKLRMLLAKRVSEIRKHRMALCKDQLQADVQSEMSDK